MQKQIEALVTALKGNTWQERQKAAEVLGDAATDSDPDVRNALLNALDDHVYWVRRSAATSLARLEDKEQPRKLGEKLIQALGGDNPLQRMIALENLAYLQNPQAYNSLIDILKQDDPLLFHLALNGLVEKQEANVIFDLYEMAQKKGKNSEQLTLAINELKTAAKESLALEKCQPVCRECLRRFDTFKLKTGLLSSISFYGCSICGLARNRIEDVKTIIAMMDNPWEAPYHQEGDTLFINMCMRKKNKKYLVDFDFLEIHPAPDINLNEEVQYLLMRSTEDGIMNPAKMKTIPVRLINTPSLNQNSLNLLSFKTKGVVD